jgi:Right handed beta helix region
VNRLPPLAVLLLFALACSESSDHPMEAVSGAAEAVAGRVNSSADAGPGSFRQAVLDANADPSLGIIRFEGGLDPIKLTTPVTYSGSQDLVIRAGGAVLDGKQLGADESAFVADGGGNLTISRLEVSRAPGNGITVKVPDDATGTFHVRLEEVVIRNNGLHGILINDQAEYFDDPASTSEEGSAAGLLVEVLRSRFERNGFSLIDSDGLRINEGGPGTLAARVRDTRFANNGADGLELDERGDGDADFSLQGTSLIGNGSFTTEDLDDGIDVDEGGAGDLIGRFNDVLASRNFEQGFDLNENGPGDLRARMVDVQAVANAEEGIEFEEDDDVAGGGNIDAELVRVTARANGANGGDAGLKLREKGDGNLVARLVEAVSVDNRMTSDEESIDGILLQEDETGDLTADLVGATARRNSGDGIQLEENEDGDLDGRIRRSTASGNGGAGADLAQVEPGAGSVEFVEFTAPGNADGPIASEGVTTSGAP